MTSIVRRFWAHQVANKTGCDGMELLDFIETVGSVVRPLRDEKAIEKERMEWMEQWTGKTVAPLGNIEVAAFEGAQRELERRYGPFSWQ